MTIDKIVTRLGSMSVALLVASSFPSELAAQTLTTLHSFIGPRDGANPLAGLTSDAAGNLYGTTSEGGGTTCAGDGTGCGTVFKLTPTGDGTYAETVLYRFSGGTDGATPLAGLIVDAAGNLYGTTQYGGGVCGGWGCGTVFRLTPNANGTYSETVLYKFTAGTDGERPYTGVLVADAAGNLYGTTVAGGGGSCAWALTCGTVFKLSPNANGGYGETVIYRFAGRSDGATPLAGPDRRSVGQSLRYDGPRRRHLL